MEKAKNLELDTFRSQLKVINFNRRLKCLMIYPI